MGGYVHGFHNLGYVLRQRDRLIVGMSYIRLFFSFNFILKPNIFKIPKRLVFILCYYLF